jgi:hypothetical protein
MNGNLQLWLSRLGHTPRMDYERWNRPIRRSVGSGFRQVLGEVATRQSRLSSSCGTKLTCLPSCPLSPSSTSKPAFVRTVANDVKDANRTNYQCDRGRRQHPRSRRPHHGQRTQTPPRCLLSQNLRLSQNLLRLRRVPPNRSKSAPSLVWLVSTNDRAEGLDWLSLLLSQKGVTNQAGIGRACTFAPARLSNAALALLCLEDFRPLGRKVVQDAGRLVRRSSCQTWTSGLYW